MVKMTHPITRYEFIAVQVSHDPDRYVAPNLDVFKSFITNAVKVTREHIKAILMKLLMAMNGKITFKVKTGFIVDVNVDYGEKFQATYVREDVSWRLKIKGICEEKSHGYVVIVLHLPLLILH